MIFEDRERFRYDLPVAVLQAKRRPYKTERAPKAVVEAGLTNRAGWISVDPQTLATSQPGIYAIGDVTAIPIPGRWKSDVPLMLPKAGVFAHAQAEVVARRIAAEIVGRPCEVTFCGDGYCMLAGNELAGFATKHSHRFMNTRASITWSPTIISRSIFVVERFALDFVPRLPWRWARCRAQVRVLLRFK